MRNHYVPRHYLKGFTAKHPPELWVYPKHQPSNPRRSYIKSVGSKDNFYSKEVEDYLGQNIENDAAPVLKKISELISITNDEKHIISRYIVSFLVRTPCGKERVKKVILKELNNLTQRENIKKFLIHKIGRELTEEEIDQALAYLQAKQREEKITKEWDTLILRESLKLVSGIHSMAWQFFTVEDGSFFLTSDCPVFFFEDIGIGNSLSEITFPMSKQVALWITPTRLIKPDYVSITKDVLEEVNYRTASMATEVYVTSKGAWAEQVVRYVYQPRRIISLDGLQASLQPL
jgi:hypothetical protein